MSAVSQQEPRRKLGQDAVLPAVRLLELGPLQNAAGPGGYFPGELCERQGSGVHREFECEKPIDGTLAQAR